ncbi:MAG: c-type cytochrome [Verrucomicrobia bacterium]|nr:c-type cytochrome [Verrucomicrobiota bacterium]
MQLTPSRMCKLALLISPLLSVSTFASEPGNSVSTAAGQPSPSAAANPDGPRSPDQALAAFQLEPGLKIALAAAEPAVIDPVALCFDEQGRMFVAENRGYPTGSGVGNPPAGMVAMLEDKDGDGRYERRTVFADGLTFPNGLLPWKGGLFVTCAPELLYFKDTDGDSRADVRRVVFTGFATNKSSQLRVCFPTLGPDNWIYLSSGLSGGKITSPDYPEHPPIDIDRSDFRFKPDTDQFEAEDGKGQFGMAFDDFGHRFTCMNRVHIQHIVLPSRHLKRNPHLAFSDTMQNVPENMVNDLLKGENRAAQIFPISANITTADSHAGTFTAACGLLIYRGTALPDEYRGNAFACDPTGNLVHWDKLIPVGSTFAARRAREGTEFLASTDNWFRPVFLATGPDGALYLCDMYRKTIEHPEYLPEEIRKRTDFDSGKGMGRIYRVSGTNQKPRDRFPKVDFGRANVKDLCAALSHPNAWQRETAQRLLIERQDRSAVPLLESLVASRRTPILGSPSGRFHALHTLEGLGALDDRTIECALLDPLPGVREAAVQLAEAHLQQSRNDGLQRLAIQHRVPPYPGPLPQGEGTTPAQHRETGPARLAEPRQSVLPLRKGEGRGEGEGNVTNSSGSSRQPEAEASRWLERLIPLAEDPDARVRFQCALTLGEIPRSQTQADRSKESPRRPRTTSTIGLQNTETDSPLDALARIAVQDSGDRWARAAILSSSAGWSAELLEAVTRQLVSGWNLPGLSTRLAPWDRSAGLRPGATQIGPRVAPDRRSALRGFRTSSTAEFLNELGRILGAEPPHSAPFGMILQATELGFDHRAAFLAGYANGLQTKVPPGTTLSVLQLAMSAMSDGSNAARLTELFAEAQSVAANASAPLPRRLRAAALLAQADGKQAAAALFPLLESQQPPELQVATVRALVQPHNAEVAAALLTPGRWRGYTPPVRSAALAALLARQEFLPAVFDVFESGMLSPAVLTPNQRNQLSKHRDPAIRRRAEALFKSMQTGDRMKAYEDSKSVLKLKPAPENGRALFKQHCASCHRLDREGFAVGPDLFGIRNQPKEAILLHVVVPDYEIAPGCAAYVVDTKDGRTLSGLILSETPTSITLRQAQGLEDTILRRDIASIVASNLSLMPQDLEEAMTRQDLADLIGYLKGE